MIAAVLCLAGAVIGALYYGLAPSRYMARMVIAPPNDPQENRDVSLSFDLLSGGADSQSESYEEFLFQLTSYETAQHLMRDEMLMAQLLDQKLIDAAELDEVQRYLADALQINRPRLGIIEESSFTELIIKHREAAFARRLLETVVQESDLMVRARTTTELTSSKDEINDMLPKVRSAEQRESLVQLLVEVQRKLIFSEVRQTFSFRTIDPLITSSKPVEPKLVLSIGIGLFAGITLAIAYVVLSLTRLTVFTGRDG